MIGLYSAEAARACDEQAASLLGFSGAVMMENAGRNATDALLEEFPGIDEVCIFAGPGNNGGDGFVIARHLLVRGIRSTVILAFPEERSKGDAALNLAIARRCGIPILSSREMSDEAISEIVSRSDLVVDALLGTGSSGPPRGEIGRLIRLTPKARRVAAVDIPSGIDASTGAVAAEAVWADLTITMLIPKVGLFVMPGADYAGKVSVVDIGVPLESLSLPAAEVNAIERLDAARMLPPRPMNMHKGDRGCVAIVGGSSIYKGAPLLAALGALRGGAGIALLVLPEEISMPLAAALPEAIILPAPSREGGLAQEAWEGVIVPWSKRIDALVIGPGMGRGKEAMALVRRVWDEWRGPMVVDADALYCLSQSGELHRRDDVMLTPHEAEAARLLESDASSVGNARLAAVKALAERYGPALLKGPRTLICDGRQTAVILEGHQALSVPGSGDVLSGLVGAFMAMGLSPYEAGVVGAHIHGRVGTILYEEGGFDGHLAREIADHIPRVVEELRYV
ncbi:NAD(P)H-hydrate dehydratase [Acetomicrobium sp. S15 = DSM 107314]|uniref:NAD(P)H-hydrate dehydratase n=1 Tax=Acetomicrobium sp. S15 = DSM 107314 TaxID=2529858 RepID=UPI0018E0E727|nr:NAD(P)H-hydrate dehydratase [Acetomicrobium sp. S15 = DSM 107314]